MNNDGFILVSKKKRAKARSLKPGVTESSSTQETAETCLEKIFKAKDDLMKSPAHESFKTNLKILQDQLAEDRKVASIVCYGLGCPACCRIARYQTGLLVILKDFFNVKVYVYDPAFTSTDIDVLKRLDFALIEENEEGKRRITEPTIFYMPHCGKALYNNLLWANWNPKALSDCIIIGNSFSSIIQNTPSRLLMKYYNYINLASDLFDEFPMKSLFKEDNIFNDMSIHYFSQRNSVDTSLKFSSSCSKPEYEDSDTEFIRCKT